MGVGARRKLAAPLPCFFRPLISARGKRGEGWWVSLLEGELLGRLEGLPVVNQISPGLHSPPTAPPSAGISEFHGCIPKDGGAWRE